MTLTSGMNIIPARMRRAIASSSIISPDAAADPLPIKIIDSDGNFVTVGAKS
jgi:hypothetical protein